MLVTIERRVITGSLHCPRGAQIDYPAQVKEGHSTSSILLSGDSEGVLHLLRGYSPKVYR